VVRTCISNDMDLKYVRSNMGLVSQKM